MNRTEFIEWFDFHRANGRGVREWYRAKKPKEREIVRDDWFEILHPLSLQQARDATNRMIATQEIHQVPPEQQARRLAEVARGLRDPEAERRKQIAESVRRDEEREARQRLEEEFGAELDRMTAGELDSLIDTIPERKRVPLRNAWGLAKDPVRHALIRPTLLRALQQRPLRDQPKSEEELATFRSDVFGSLGEAPDFSVKTNDQWE